MILNGNDHQYMTRIVFAAVVSLLCLALTSCMHMAMPGMHESNGETTAVEPATEIVVITAGIRASVTFPPLRLREEAPLEMRLVDSETLEPISGSKVYFHAVYESTSSQGLSDHSESQPRGLDSIHGGHGDTECDTTETLIAESHHRGIYATTFVAPRSGVYTLKFRAASIADRPLAPEPVVEARRIVVDPGHEHRDDMSGMHGSSTLVIIGGILMGAMMIAMLVGH